MNSYFFVNPASGHYSEAKLQRVLAKLVDNGIRPVVYQVKTPVEIYEYCAIINKDKESHMVIVAGGDGTFNAVINGLEPGTSTVAIIPFGTSNVLAAEIGIISNHDAVERIIAGKTAPLSIGLLEMKERTLRFVLMAGIGLDGAVVRDVLPLAKRYLKQGAYALAAFKRVLNWCPDMFHLNGLKCHTAVICNASRYGGNFIMSPGSSPFSAGISALCITDHKRIAYLKCIYNLVTGRTSTSSQMQRLNASEFVIAGNQPIQIDGDFVGYSPARISEMKEFARIII